MTILATDIGGIRMRLPLAGGPTPLRQRRQER